MTTIELQPARSFLARVGRAVADGYIRMCERSHLSACAQEAVDLFALSDAELAARGLTRSTVIPHAFRGHCIY